MSPSELDQFNNLCKAIAEQELLDANVFPDAKDDEDIRAELEGVSPLASEERPKTSLRERIALRLAKAPDPAHPEDNNLSEGFRLKKDTSGIKLSKIEHERIAAETPTVIKNRIDNKP